MSVRLKVKQVEKDTSSEGSLINTQQDVVVDSKTSSSEVKKKIHHSNDSSKAVSSSSSSSSSSASLSSSSSATDSSSSWNELITYNKTSSSDKAKDPEVKKSSIFSWVKYCFSSSLPSLTNKDLI